LQPGPQGSGFGRIGSGQLARHISQDDMPGCPEQVHFASDVQACSVGVLTCRNILLVLGFGVGDELVGLGGNRLDEEV
jgi:hypothetical protein